MRRGFEEYLAILVGGKITASCKSATVQTFSTALKKSPKPQKLLSFGEDPVDAVGACGAVREDEGRSRPQSVYIRAAEFIVTREGCAHASPVLTEDSLEVVASDCLRVGRGRRTVRGRRGSAGARQSQAALCGVKVRSLG